MIATACSNFTQRLPLMTNVLARMTFPVSVSRVLSVRFPAHGLSSKVLYRLHATFTSSLHSSTAAGSLRSFRDQSATGRATSAFHKWSSCPVAATVWQRLQCRSTSAAPDVFPKRVTRRTKKKEIEHRNRVNITLILFVLCNF